MEAWISLYKSLGIEGLILSSLNEKYSVQIRIDAVVDYLSRGYLLDRVQFKPVQMSNVKRLALISTKLYAHLLVKLLYMVMNLPIAHVLPHKESHQNHISKHNLRISDASHTNPHLQEYDSPISHILFDLSELILF